MNATHIPDRVMVYGVTGSGKTTLAKAIAAKTGLPLIDVDELTWKPGWEPVPDDEQRRAFIELCDGERWVMDTAYAKWIDVPLARVQVIVALDYPRWLSLARLLRRTLSRVVDGKPICNGNAETWRQMLSRDSIIAWHFKSFARKRRRVSEWSSQPDRWQVVVHRWPSQTDAWLAQLPAGPEATASPVPRNGR